MDRPQALLGLRLLALTAVSRGVVACGGATDSPPSQADASADTSFLEASSSADASGLEALPPLDAGADASPDSNADAALSCGDLADAAVASFERVIGENRACQTDEDCTEFFLGLSGTCVAPCGVLTSVAGAGVVADAATSLCAPFIEAGCTPRVFPCPAPPPRICAGDTCATFDTYLTQVSPTLTHGLCATFQLNYHPLAGAAQAPHDLVVTLTSSGGTLYADTGCTKPLADNPVIIPSGSTSTALGFVPSSAGRCWITVGGVVSSWMAE